MKRSDTATWIASPDCSRQATTQTKPTSLVEQPCTAHLQDCMAEDTCTSRNHCGSGQTPTSHSMEACHLNLSTKDTVYFRFSNQNADLTQPSSNPNLSADREFDVFNYGGTWNHIFGPTTVMQLTFGTNPPNNPGIGRHLGGLTRPDFIDQTGLEMYQRDVFGDPLVSMGFGSYNAGGGAGGTVTGGRGLQLHFRSGTAGPPQVLAIHCSASVQPQPRRHRPEHHQPGPAVLFHGRHPRMAATADEPLALLDAVELLHPAANHGRHDARCRLRGIRNPEADRLFPVQQRIEPRPWRCAAAAAAAFVRGSRRGFEPVQRVVLRLAGESSETLFGRTAIQPELLPLEPE